MKWGGKHAKTILDQFLAMLGPVFDSETPKSWTSFWLYSAHIYIYICIYVYVYIYMATYVEICCRVARVSKLALSLLRVIWCPSFTLFVICFFFKVVFLLEVEWEFSKGDKNGMFEIGTSIVCGTYHVVLAISSSFSKFLVPMLSH